MFKKILLLLLLSFVRERGWSQCAGIASTPRAASDCAAHAIPAGKIAALDPTHPYSLGELVDIAEHNNPRTRVVWERAKQKAKQLGIAKSAYFPVSTGIATFADERLIEPFPEPLAPRGYIMVEATVVQPEACRHLDVYQRVISGLATIHSEPRRRPESPIE
jgi:outer membrane protein TolC